MAMSGIQKYFLIVLMSQVVLSLLNSLFTLSDVNVAITLFGFYGVIRMHRWSLLAV